MPVDFGLVSVLGRFAQTTGVKAFLILFLIFYIVFALLILRQVVLMSEKLSTPLSSILRFIAIIHAGVACALLLLIMGSF